MQDPLKVVQVVQLPKWYLKSCFTTSMALREEEHSPGRRKEAHLRSIPAPREDVPGLAAPRGAQGRGRLWAESRPWVALPVL